MEMKLVHPQRYWEPEDFIRANNAKWFPDLVKVALDVIDRIPDPNQLCGPISTGGMGCIHKNRLIFENGILELEAEGLNVFNQLPIETAFIRFSRVWRESGNTGYFWDILNEFYLPIFKSGKIKRAHFIPGFRASTGTRWEYRTTAEYGIPRRLLDKDWLNRVKIRAGFA